MALTKSARAWLERRMFGTVRNDLNLARTATTNSRPQADTIVKMKDKPLIISLQKSSFTTNISSVVLDDFFMGESRHFSRLTFGHSCKETKRTPFPAYYMRRGL